MHRIRKERRQTNKKAGSTSHPFPIMYLFSFPSEKCSVITIYVFNISIPLLFCVFSYLWKEIFHEGKAVYGKHVGIFLMFIFAPCKVNIPIYAGEFFLRFFLFYTKFTFPCMQGDLNKSNIRNIFVGHK
jgi:hypothetical protein